MNGVGARFHCINHYHVMFDFFLFFLSLSLSVSLSVSLCLSRFGTFDLSRSNYRCLWVTTMIRWKEDHPTQ